MYRNITSYLCFASITPIVIISSDSSVRLVTSSRKMYTRCMISFAHILYLTVLFLFSFNKSRRSVALFFPSLFIYWRWLVQKNLVMELLRFFMRGSNTFSPNLLVPCFKLYVCINLQVCKLSIPDKSFLMCNIVIKIIIAVSELYSPFFYYFLVNVATVVAVLWLFLLDFWYFSSASSAMSSTSSGSYYPSEYL